MKRWLLVPLLSVALSGCFMVKDMKAITPQVDAFHHQLNAQQFDQIYANAADDLKQATTHDHFARFLGAIHRKLGNTKLTKQGGFNDNINPSGHFVTIVFTTTFERGQGTETFMYRLVGETPKLAGYHINSEALILN